MPLPLLKRWVVQPTIPADVAHGLSEYPHILRQFLYNRNVRNLTDARKYLSAEGSQYDPFLLKDMPQTVDRLIWAIDHGEPIAVYGDYDVDGVTATALLVQVLQRMGGVVRGYIPNRFDEGYGLNNEALDNLHAEGVRLVVTVDCGIRSPAEVAHASQLGMDIIVSDHHEPHDGVPQAVGVICPKQSGDVYPEKNLAGVGLAYKIAEALLDIRPLQHDRVEDWLDLVAVGTVADIVPLEGENRSLVKTGLELLRGGYRQGLLSLAGAAGLDISHVTAREIGFMLGPRLNAAGRLESAIASYDLLMADEVQAAGALAQTLDDQNRQRQELTRNMGERAESLIAEEETKNLLFAGDPDFNMGIVGLVASRLTETHYRPSVVASIGKEFTRASCRSIPEFHITHALDECADLLVHHGGHAMAAGFTIRTNQLPDLVSRLYAIADRELADHDLRPVLRADMEISLEKMDPQEILTSIDMLEPTGQNNPEALFVSRFLQVVRHRTVGQDGKHLRLTVRDGSVMYDAIAFRQGHWKASMPEFVDLLYRYERNRFRGTETLQLNVRDLKPSGA